VGCNRGLAFRYETHHGVKFSPQAINAAVRLSQRYIADRFLPDKAIDLMDEAGAMIQLRAALMGEDGEGKKSPRVRAGCRPPPKPVITLSPTSPSPLHPLLALKLNLKVSLASDFLSHCVFQ
jgi:hypothetical protein